MSRTYRREMEYKYDAYGRLWTRDELEAAGLDDQYVKVPWVGDILSLPDWVTRHPPPYFNHVRVTRGLKGRYIINTRARDNKPSDKPDKAFKQMNRRIERAAIKQALAQRRDIPVFKHCDQWEWT